MKPDLAKLTFPKAVRFRQSKLRLPVLIEEKLDGERLLLTKGFACSRRLNQYGKFENKWDRMPDQIKAMAADTPVDGELVWPGHEASDVPTAVKEKSPELTFTGFRILEDLYPHEHHMRVQDLGIAAPKLYGAYTELPEVHEENMLEYAATLGYEGWVLKERCKYPSWWKMKLEYTTDVIVMNFKMATAGQYLGGVGSIEAGVFVDGILRPVAFVSGMKRPVRDALTENDFGRVMEIKHNGVLSQGRLRHPRFLRWRDDKNLAECTLEQFTNAERERIRKKYTAGTD